MSEVKTLEEKIEGKLKMLKFTAEDTEKILETEDVKAIERHGGALESIIDKTHQLKLQFRNCEQSKTTRTLWRLEVGQKIWKPKLINLKCLLKK